MRTIVPITAGQNSTVSLPPAPLVQERVGMRRSLPYPSPRRRPCAEREFVSFSHGTEIAALLLLLAVNVFAAEYLDKSVFAAVNATGSIALMGVLLFFCRQQLSQTPLLMWTPILWFRVSSAVYFGFGQLVPYIANPTTLAWMQETYPFLDSDIQKLNIIILLAILCVLAGAALIRPLGSSALRKRADQIDKLPIYACLFVVFGAILRYGLIVPAALGYLAPLPGVFIFLGKTYSAGLLLLLIYGLRWRGLALLLAVTLTLVELAVGTLLFAKTEVLITIVFSTLALWYNRPSYLRLGICFLIALSIYASLGNLVLFGREEIIRRYASADAAVSPDERFQIMKRYFAGDTSQWDYVRGDSQQSLYRLSYVNVAATVVDWHDRGKPGESLKFAFIAMIPRIIWPDKPVISNVGERTYQKITGYTGTSYSPGLFAEAYWNFGWSGIPMTMFPFGVFLGFLSRLAITVMKRGQWGSLPAVLGGLYIGLRVDGSYVLDVIAAGSIVIFMYAILQYMDAIFMQFRKRHV